MADRSPEEVWQMPEDELSSFLNNESFRKKKEIRFYAPNFMYYQSSIHSPKPADFPTISVTGSGCSLKCKHCNRVVLATMYPATTPESLFKLCSRLKNEGACGCLVSGGCRNNGSVPLDRFVGAIAKVKRELGMTVFVHTGMISSAAAENLAEAGVDAALIDIIGSDETIREIYKLKITVSDFARSLDALDRAHLPFIPHVNVGLHYGMLKGELEALKMISDHKPSAIVVIAFMPIRGTEMEKVNPPSPINIARVIAIARLMFPHTPVVLGCMRPKGKHRAETDVLGVKAGADGIAFPTEEAIEFSRQQGYEISFSSFCCSQIYVDMKL